MVSASGIGARRLSLSGMPVPSTPFVFVPQPWSRPCAIAHAWEGPAAKLVTPRNDGSGAMMAVGEIEAGRPDTLPQPTSSPVAVEPKTDVSPPPVRVMV